MNFLKKKGIVLYLMLLFLHCLCIQFEWDFAQFYTKIILLPFLLRLFILQYTGERGSSIRFYLPIIALVGSWGGDIFLEFEGSNFFLVGMLCFMTTHIANSIYFYKMQVPSPFNTKEIRISIPVILVLYFIVIYIIKANLGVFLIPVIVYMLLIGWMAILAINLNASKQFESAAIQFFIPGACLFVLSDTLLAVNKFSLQESSLGIFIMLTYGLAQLYLVMGYYKTNFQRHKKAPINDYRSCMV